MRPWSATTAMVSLLVFATATRPDPNTATPPVFFELNDGSRPASSVGVTVSPASRHRAPRPRSLISSDPSAAKAIPLTSASRARSVACQERRNWTSGRCASTAWLRTSAAQANSNPLPLQLVILPLKSPELMAPATSPVSSMPQSTEQKSSLAPVRLARKVGAGLTLAAVVIYFLGVPLLDLLELKTYDMRLRALRHAPPQHVTIAAIDERSLAELGRWPWSRTVLATLVDRLEQAGARVVAFDVFFPEPETRPSDERLARAVGGDRRIVLSSVFLLDPAEARQVGVERVESARQGMTRHAITDVRRTGADSEFAMPKPHGVLANIPRLQGSAAYSGHINVLPDRADGTVR